MKKKHIIILAVTVTLTTLFTYTSLANQKTEIGLNPNFFPNHEIVIDNSKISALPAIESKAELSQETLRQEAIIEDSLFSVSITEKKLLENAAATVTFSESISSEEVLSILEKSDATLEYAVINYTDLETGMRVTGWTDDLSKENLTEKLNYLNETYGETVMNGIASAKLEISLLDKSYDELCANEAVYFVDMTETIIRLESNDYDEELEIQVMDLSWDLDKID